jgi:general stress protein CsbA
VGNYSGSVVGLAMQSLFAIVTMQNWQGLVLLSVVFLMSIVVELFLSEKYLLFIPSLVASERKLMLCGNNGFALL